MFLGGRVIVVTDTFSVEEIIVERRVAMFWEAHHRSKKTRGKEEGKKRTYGGREKGDINNSLCTYMEDSGMEGFPILSYSSDWKRRHGALKLHRVQRYLK